MSRRTARVGGLLLAGFLFGSLVLAFPAAAQQQEEGLEVALKGVEAPVGSGELTTTLAMSGTAWGAGQELDQRDFSASFNGKKAEVIEATPLGQSSGRKLAVVLAIDTSGSMLPDNIERAKAAADAFATRMEPGTRMGVVAFSDQPVVVQELTSDLEQVRAAIRGLTAQGNTALYDAVIQSSQLLGKEDAQRNLVLLSDGLHDGPPTTITQAIDAANKNEVDIYTVGLGPGGDENSANLERMAKATGGKAFSAAPEQLERLYAVLATTLASQYVVKIALPPGLAGTVNFRLQVRANGATGRYAKPDLFLGQGVSPPAVPPAYRGRWRAPGGSGGSGPRLDQVERGRRDVLELVGDDVHRGREGRQRGLVVLGGVGRGPGDLGRRGAGVGVVDVDVEAQPRRRHGEHPAELPAAQDADGGAGAQRLSHPAPRGRRPRAPRARRRAARPARRPTSARIAAAIRPALTAPASPMAMVATGKPRGIWTME